MCTGPKVDTNKLAPDEAWLEKFDIEAFEKDIKELGKTLAKAQGEDDVKHLKRIIFWNRVFAVLGFSTMWMTPNPFTIVCISTAIFSSWTMLAHHVCHGGYDKTEASKEGYSRFQYALGSIKRRVLDWLDWMLPEAWNTEHNLLHHYHLNELTDPDLVQRNTTRLRKSNVPYAIKYFLLGFFIVSWKWLYYAPNTFSQLEYARYRKEHGGIDEKMEKLNLATSYNLTYIFQPLPWVSQLQLLRRVFIPYILFRFLAPSLFFYYTVGFWACKNALINLVLADMLTNIHSFIMIVTNHAGEDMYFFSSPCRPKTGTFYLRQILGSTNFATGSDMNDFFHGWLNYQIEHHLFPDLSMLSYQKAQPLVKALCEKHGVPYIQENVFIRLRKTVDIIVGKTSMRRFPEEHLLTK